MGDKEGMDGAGSGGAKKERFHTYMLLLTNLFLL